MLRALFIHDRNIHRGSITAFNGLDGRIEGWQDVPYHTDVNVYQAALHSAAMDQTGNDRLESRPIIVHNLWKKFRVEDVTFERGGHGGGNKRLHEKIFVNPEKKRSL